MPFIMEKTIERLKELLVNGKDSMSTISKEEMTRKSDASKWSKQEILGHLIDSGIQNLQRFNEVQFAAQPYVIRRYRQDDLVKSNAYQIAKKEELIGLWTSLNLRIISIMERQIKDTLDYKVKIGKVTTDLRFLMDDYVDHLEHHLAQILQDESINAH
jgi:hypothetical protein